VEKYGKFVFCPKYLKSVRWVDFRKLCIANRHIQARDEFEAYELFKFETGNKVTGMERKLKDKQKKADKKANK